MRTVHLGPGLRPGLRHGLGPADRVTLTRAVLACVVAVLAAVSFARPVPVAALVSIAAVALVLDAVDGWVARRTGTASPFGARFDMEADAFLILVLSVYVARSTGWWVLLIGVARYALLLATWLLPWLREPSPPRHWAKVVAAVQGVVLLVATADVLPQRVTGAALLAALVLLAESFGRQVWWLWRRRPDDGRHTVRPVLTVLAGALVWAALVAPDRVEQLTPGGFARIPLEGLLVVALALVLRAQARGAAAVLFGLALGVLTLLKALDLGFLAVLDRPFDPVSDWVYLGPGVGVLGDSVGTAGAYALVAVVVLLVTVVLVVMPWAVARVTAVAARHPRRALRTLGALGLVWVLCAVAGMQVSPVAGVASTSAVGFAVDEVSQVRAGIEDRQVFARAIADDPLRATPDDRLLAGLRGKDVLVVFVESYGRVAVEGSTFSPGVDAVLDDGTRRLRDAGFSARSAFLTSPTFGAASWLAHSTLQSGLWVDSQQRYDQLVGTDRMTLVDAFGRAGWRTVFDVPSITRDWPEGATFYGFDQLYDARNVGYQGPSFGYATMPDQYTLAAFRQRELAPRHRAPVMAEIDLASSHHPWAPLPRLVDWADVGDGSVFDGMPEQGDSADDVFRDPDLVRAAYGRSIEYSLESLVSFVETDPDPDLVLVVLGDHQPHTYVTGASPGHDVPVSVIAHDPAVLDRIRGWGWQDGLHPSPTAPVWPMDSFRGRFLTAYGRP